MVLAVEAGVAKKTNIFNFNFAMNVEDLNRKLNDLDVFPVYVGFHALPRCSFTSSVQRQWDAHLFRHGWWSCNVRTDHKALSRFNQMMSASSMHAIFEIFAEVGAHRWPSFSN